MSYGFSRGKSPTEQTAIDHFMVEQETTAAPPRAESRQEARGKGFTGNMCSVCGSIHMVVAGHCEVCTSCGSTTGCS